MPESVREVGDLAQAVSEADRPVHQLRIAERLAPYEHSLEQIRLGVAVKQRVAVIDRQVRVQQVALDLQADILIQLTAVRDLVIGQGEGMGPLEIIRVPCAPESAIMRRHPHAVLQ